MLMYLADLKVKQKITIMLKLFRCIRTIDTLLNEKENKRSDNSLKYI